ncbi:MFS transporter [Campylobacter corcagiensis]|uniref:MFS transporter n=1 Tax=Campylobacter corcagiensis TaxID=1448857 RepID=A0A7M1LE93_9BACT|nr:MFS transporter [Campylobacter corcagiensis]QKF64938.1 proton antiporter protein, major facilitator superfamily [Campylobacter corcagiensis]QOQ86902.1 MFS transporter [Campylobacter corcagiensis]
MNQHIALLKHNKTIRILALIQLICYFGAWFSHVGIFTLLINLNAATWMIGLTAASAYIPSVILAPFAGVIIDRFRAYPLFFIFMFIEAITVILLLLVDSLEWFWFLQLMVFIRMGTAGIYFQVEMSLLPRILSKDDLKIANEIHSIIWALSYTLGMAFAGLFVAKYGVYNSFIFDFLIYIVGIALLIKLNLKENKKSTQQKAIHMIVQGFIYLKNNPFLIKLLLLHGFVAVTTYDTLIGILAKVNYKEILSASLTIGVLNTIRAFGLIVGPFVLSKFVNSKNLFYIFIAQGVGLISWGLLQGNFYLSFIGLFVTGLTTSTLWSYTYTLVQNVCDSKFYGRVIAYLDMIYLGIAAITSILVGFLYDLGLPAWLITVLMGVHFIIAALYYTKNIYHKL